MYLTRFAVNVARREARRLLGSPQCMHSAVLHGFPPDTPLVTGGGRVLWRVDRDRQKDAAWLYILSPVEPDLTHLVEQAGWPTRATWETLPYERLLDRLEAGQRWAFRLRANPVRTVRRDLEHQPHSMVGKRAGFVTVGQQEEWLTEKRAENCGFRVVRRADDELELVVGDRRVERFVRSDEGGNRRTVTLSTAQFDGVLEVLDPDRLRRSLTCGIGRAKGYGCGLLTLAPVG